MKQVYGWGAKCKIDTKRTFAELMQLIGQSATGISYYVDADADPRSATRRNFVNFRVRGRSNTVRRLKFLS